MIRNLFHFAGSVGVVAALLALSGCGGAQSPADRTPAAQSGHYEGDGNHSAEEPAHVEGDVHDHGAHTAHEHPDEGPHGGHLIELGNEEYHAELLHDHATHTVTIYLLDAAGKQPVAVSAAEVTLQLLEDGQFVDYALKAAAGPSDPQGATSRFEVVDEHLCDALCEEDHLRGRLTVTIDEKPYTGMIEHGAHDHDAPEHDAT